MAFLAALALVGLVRTGLADDEKSGDVPAPSASRYAGEYVHRFVQRSRLEAGNPAMMQELESLQRAAKAGPTGKGILDTLQTLDEATRTPLVRLVEANTRPLAQNFSDADAQLERQVTSLVNTWLPVRTALVEARLLLASVEDDPATKTLSEPDWQYPSLWLAGAIALVILTLVVLHDRRHELRRALLGGQIGPVRLLLFLLVVDGCLVVLWEMSSHKPGATAVRTLSPEKQKNVTLAWDFAERQAIETENAKLADEVAALSRTERDLDKQCTEAQNGLEQRIVESFKPSGGGVAEPWLRSRRMAVSVAKWLGTMGKVSAAIDQDLAAIPKLRERIEAIDQARLSGQKATAWIHRCEVAGMILLVAAAVVLRGRDVAARRKEQAITCPMCMGRVHVEYEGARKARNQVVRCGNLLSEQPRIECPYVIPGAYRRMPKLVYPTLGIPKAGKTHWLAMTYWQLHRGNYPKSVRFEKLQRLQPTAAEDFDGIVEQILMSRLGTAATQRDRIPYPAIFHFQDCDRLGRTNVLVNVFDYSGEVTQDMRIDDYRRRRAMGGDGFLFFLDPTYPAEPQAKALAAFREDLRILKGLKKSQAVRVPVALCVSKIDLLASQSYAMPGGGDAIARFYDELRRIDPTGERVSRGVLQARSRLVAQLRDTIWPGWQIERMIRDLFGGQHMFFPLTPVGLDGCGQTDLSLRTIAPFGLLEPLLWLLERSGYPVLGS